MNKLLSFIFLAFLNTTAFAATPVNTSIANDPCLIKDNQCDGTFTVYECKIE